MFFTSDEFGTHSTQYSFRAEFVESPWFLEVAFIESNENRAFVRFKRPGYPFSQAFVRH